jgi:hypothetical protein
MTRRTDRLTGGDVTPKYLEHEQVVMSRGNRTGITIIVAVHSTALGAAQLACVPVHPHMCQLAG